MSGRILVIDDEELFREDLATLLRQEGYECETAADGESGLRRAAEADFDIVLTDLVMPGVDGVDVVDRVTASAPGTAVLLITAFGSLETAVAAFRRGAVDYLLKPVVPDDVIAKVRHCLAHRRLQDEVRYLRRTLRDAGAGSTLVGSSPVMESVRGFITKVAATDSTVLVTGESGTGKELVARLLHKSSQNADGPFIAINCAALPHELMESELFGHVRGAFTGAVSDKPGLFERASGGTLFLDEIAELPLSLQAKLLRAIERKEFLRVGGLRPATSSARIVSATNRTLDREVAEGRFREDLFYRVRVVEIHVPPLRDHATDIPQLSERIVERLNHRLKRHVLGIAPDALALLTAFAWPGNVRELENVLERAMILTETERIERHHLPAEIDGLATASDAPVDLRSAVRTFERQHIRRILAEVGGSRDEAARRLGIDPSTLYRRLKGSDT